MVMQWQQAPIQFNSGINQKTDDKQVIPGQWLVLENLEMQKTGRFKKRRGFTLSANTSDLLGTTITENNLASVSLPRLSDSSLRCSDFIDLGIKANKQKFSRATFGQGNGGGGIAYSVDNDAGTAGELRYRLLDINQNIEADYKLFDIDMTAGRMSKWVSISGDNSKHGFVGGLFITGSGVNANIGLVRGSTSFYTLASNVNFANLSAYSTDTYTFIVYSDIGAGNTKVLRYNAQNILDYSTTIAINNKPTAVSCNGTYVWVVVDATLYRFAMDLTGVTNIRTATSGTVVQCAFDGTFITDNGTNAIIISNRFGNEFTQYGLQASNVSPFVINTDEIYAIFTQRKPSNINEWAGGFLIKRIDNVARVSLEGAGYLSTFNDYDGAASSGKSTIEMGCLFGYMSQFTGLSQPYKGFSPIITADSMMLGQFISGSSCYAETIDRDIIYTTSALRLFTGITASSLSSTAPMSMLYGWNYSPVISAVTLGAGVTTLIAGEYQVLALYQQTSSGGNIVRSVASAIVKYTHTVNKDFTVTIKSPTCEGARIIQGSISVYVVPPGETIFYAAATKIKIAESTTVTITSYDELDVLYTTGGVLEDVPPPAVVGAPSFAKNRVWIFSAEQPQLRFSDEIFSGELPMFNEIFSLQLPAGGGSGQVVKEIDGKIVAFQKYQISATFGDGPDAAGQGGFSPLQIVARDIGSIVAGSVITTNDGIFFLSSKGLWLLNRGLQLEFIGTGIDDDAANIVCGTKLTDVEQIWFFTSTKALIWDNYHKLWTTAPTGLTNITSSKIINGVLTIVANNKIYTLTSATTDNGTAITVRGKTGWISLAGLKGFERIRRIMFLTDQKSATTMTVKLRYNFIDTVAETFTITSADIVDSGNNVQWLMRPKVQKCECFQIEFETSSSGATLELSNIAIEYGAKSGLFRLPATKKIGGV